MNKAVKIIKAIFIKIFYYKPGKTKLAGLTFLILLSGKLAADENINLQNLVFIMIISFIWLTLFIRNVISINKGSDCC